VCGAYTAGDGDVTPGTHEADPNFNYTGQFGDLRKRRITEETCRKFNVRITGSNVRFPYTNDKNQVVAYKARDKDKNFTYHGQKTTRLFGQNLFGKGKRVVITEGEMDALSVWEAMPGDRKSVV
jgi:twinkle protein